nr:hypothetical protein L203_00235 [Cryptococcus depauperatus CBS 7841]
MTVAPTPIAGQLSTQEKLLLSQAVYKLGAINWPRVSQLLRDHPCIQGKSQALFSPESCENIYKELMGAINMNVPVPDGIKPHAKAHLHLAQTHYIARMSELQEMIASYEARFTQLMSDINALRSGEMDTSLREEIKSALERRFGEKKMKEFTINNAQILLALEEGSIKEGEVDTEILEKSQKKEIESNREKKQNVKDTEKTTDNIDTAYGRLEALPAAIATPVRETKSATVNSKDSTDTPSVASPLSSPPSDVSPEAPATRSNKRKAMAQPKGAPPAKKNGRRNTALAIHTETEEESEARAGQEAKEDESGLKKDVVIVEDEPDHKTRGRRSKRESVRRKQESPEATSPAGSRRAPSVSSTASAATPGEERRLSRRAGGRRGMRDGVVSKTVREYTTDADDHGEPPEETEHETRKSTRTSRRKSAAVDSTSTPTPTTARGTRASARIHRLDPRELEEDDDRDDHDDIKPKEPTPFSTAPAPIPQTIPSATNLTLSKPPRFKATKVTKTFLLSLHETIASHKFGTVFESPVRKSEAPDYYNVIKRPMDLKTIKSKIKDGRIDNIDELERDVLLIFSNAMMYNAHGSQVHEMAREMMRDCEGHFAYFRNMELELEGDGQ